MQIKGRNISLKFKILAFSKILIATFVTFGFGGMECKIIEILVNHIL